MSERKVFVSRPSSGMRHRRISWNIWMTGWYDVICDPFRWGRRIIRTEHQSKEFGN